MSDEKDRSEKMSELIGLFDVAVDYMNLCEKPLVIDQLALEWAIGLIGSKAIKEAYYRYLNIKKPLEVKKYGNTN